MALEIPSQTQNALAAAEEGGEEGVLYQQAVVASSINKAQRNFLSAVFRVSLRSSRLEFLTQWSQFNRQRS